METTPHKGVLICTVMLQKCDVGLLLLAIADCNTIFRGPIRCRHHVQYYISDYLNVLTQGSLRRGHPKKNLELPISTRTDCEV
jgi:hypothetical protein